MIPGRPRGTEALASTETSTEGRFEMPARVVQRLRAEPEDSGGQHDVRPHVPLRVSSAQDDVCRAVDCRRLETSERLIVKVGED